MSNSYEAAPNDSRYIPFTQQDYCCVPTSILMVMYRNNIPLIPSEELGHHLGLTVPPNAANLFYKARVSDIPPSEAGYGTQIQNPNYEPNNVFKKLKIPLFFALKLANEIADAHDLVNELQGVEDGNTDALLCFNYGVICGEYKQNSGHVVVFDRIIDGKVRIVDALREHPKWRIVEPSLLFSAIKQHGSENSGGVWHFKPMKESLPKSKK